MSACSSSADPEQGDSLYTPEDDITITRQATQGTQSGTVYSADYRISNDGPDPLTYTVTFEFRDAGGKGITEVVKQRVDDHETYSGTVSTAWRRGSGTSGVHVVDVTIR
ncbi:hypothetical protein [Streptomyces sp. AS02]|uniref:hypothetical protein n=1 Tax=Streptomyces sp. AS02 TaxID=2938946 RepID=UPI00201FE009|nr:hypothetical protein [Streptomyces sp. AS02]MCL8011719.1 hypothetical protein [Streptomyces sp. AS02]